MVKYKHKIDDSYLIVTPFCPATVYHTPSPMLHTSTICPKIIGRAPVYEETQVKIMISKIY